MKIYKKIKFIISIVTKYAPFVFSDFSTTSFKQKAFDFYARLYMQSRFLYLLFKLGQVEERGGNSSDVTFLEDTIS